MDDKHLNLLEAYDRASMELENYLSEKDEENHRKRANHIVDGFLTVCVVVGAYTIRNWLGKRKV